MYSALFLERLKTFVERGKSKICRCGNYSRADANQGRKPLIFRRFFLRKLFKGGNYSRPETICGNKVGQNMTMIQSSTCDPKNTLFHARAVKIKGLFFLYTYLKLFIFSLAVKHSHKML